MHHRHAGFFFRWSNECGEVWLEVDRCYCMQVWWSWIIAGTSFKMKSGDNSNLFDRQHLAFILQTQPGYIIWSLVLKCNLNTQSWSHARTHSLDYSVSHKHTCSALMMKRQDVLASAWVSHHLWQLLLSLTTLSAQEVIRELDYHRQP